MGEPAGAPRRILVRGCSGSGKTTVAATLAGRLGVPHVELDALFHQPGWHPRDHDEFCVDVAERTTSDGWVVDGNYDSKGVQDVVASHVQLVVWLDLPRWVTLARVVRRTIARGLLRRELWNGNRESLASLFRRDPEDNIVLWTWRMWPNYHEQALAAREDPRWAHAEVVRLTSQDEVDDFLANRDG